MKHFIRQHLWWLTCIVALLLLVAHTLRLATLTVDSTSILLLVVMLVSPFVAAIKKIKFGEFEAEIDPAEVKRLKDETAGGADMGLYVCASRRVPPHGDALRRIHEHPCAIRRDEPWHGRDADRKIGGPRYLLGRRVKLEINTLRRLR
jgi:hypothetical protein